MSQKMIDLIIFQPEIWIHSPGAHLQKIISHWSTFLPSKNTFRPIFHLITIIRIYFWYDPVELDFIRGGPKSSRPRDPSFDLESSRSFLKKLIISMSMIKISPQDIRVLISNCIMCPDVNQNIFFLELLSDLIDSHKNVFNVPDYQKLMFQQFRTPNELKFSSALKVLCKLSQHDFFQNLFKLISILPSSFYTEHLFYQLLPILSLFPLIYPLVSICSLSLSKDSINKLIATFTTLQFSYSDLQQMQHNSLWIFYFLIVFVKSDISIDCLTLLFSNIFKHKIMFNSISFLNNTTKFIFQLTGYDFSNFCIHVSLNAYQSYLEQNVTENYSLICINCLDLLLIRPINSDLNVGIFFQDSIFFSIPKIPSSNKNQKIIPNSYEDIKSMFNFSSRPCTLR